MIISLSGVDSAGKTTQLELLCAHLERTGRRPVRFWYRPGYSAELDALRGLVRRLRPGAMPHTSSDPGGHARAFASPRVRRTWVAMALADTAVQYALKLRALARGRVVVCDRYLADSAMDLGLRFPELAAWAERGFRAIEAVSPAPDVALLLMLPHDEMLRRAAEKDEPFPDPPAIRDERYARYQRLAAAGRLTVVDADQRREAVHADIVAHVERALSLIPPTAEEV